MVAQWLATLPHSKKILGSKHQLAEAFSVWSLQTKTWGTHMYLVG